MAVPASRAPAHSVPAHDLRLLKVTVLAQPGRRNAQTFRMWAHSVSHVPTMGQHFTALARGQRDVGAVSRVAGRTRPSRGVLGSSLPAARAPHAVRLSCLPSRSRPSLEEAVQWRESLDKLLQNNCECAQLFAQVSGGGEVRGQDTPELPVSPFPGFDISSVFQNDLNKG